MASTAEHVPATSWQDDFQPSLWALLERSPKTRQAIQEIPADLMSKTESTLERLIRQKNKRSVFPRTLGLLKISFWDEYRRAWHEKELMKADHIFHNICTPAYYYSVLKNPLYIAWLIHPPGDELVLQKELLGIGFKKLREAMEAPIYDVVYQNLKETDEFGNIRNTTKKIKRVNVALVREIHALVKTLQDRVHGAVIQKQQIAALQVQVPLDAMPKDPLKMSLADPNLSLEDLNTFEMKLKDIDGKIGQVLPAAPDEGEVMEAEGVDVDAEPEFTP